MPTLPLREGAWTDRKFHLQSFPTYDYAGMIRLPTTEAPDRSLGKPPRQHILQLIWEQGRAFDGELSNVLGIFLTAVRKDLGHLCKALLSI